MNPELLLAHFDRISDAPDAIPRLRSFILDLAVRGKLVEQDPKDEPASELLKRIQVEKVRLVKNGKISTQQPVPQIGAEELPFPAPSGWNWARLAAISRRIHYGFTASANPSLKDVRLLRITDIQNNQVDWSSVPGCEISEREVDQYKLQQGDILIARTGGTIGKTFLVSQIPVTAVFASYLIRVQKSSEFYDRYLKFFLESPAYWKQLQEGARGGGQPNVNGQTLGKITVVVPPLAEQHRIVTKVDELMALCDRLEAERNEQESRRDRLAAASLHHLNNGANSEAFRNYARFYLSHLPRLTTRPEHVQPFRQTILNLAVRGQLIPQDSNAEPVDTLLSKNDRVRQQIVRTDRRADTDRQVLLAAEDKWNIPPSWCWSALADLVLFIDYRGKTPVKTEKGVRLITAKNVKKGFINPSPEEFLSERDYHIWMTRGFPKEGDILFTTEAPMGNAAVVRLSKRFALAQRVICFRPYHAVIPNFLTLQLLAEPFQRILDKTATGLTAKGIKAAKLRRLPVAVPPIAEQHQIVARVDELMTLCSQLEGQLATSQTGTCRLLESVLYHAIKDSAVDWKTPLTHSARRFRD
jgi:type I restriction enzyme S subunit